MKLRYLVGLSLVMVSCQDSQDSKTSEKKVEPVVKEAAPEAKKKAAPEEKVAPEEKADVASASVSPKDLYKKQAEVLIGKIDSATADEVSALSQELTKTGLSMLPTLIQLHAECTEYLGAIQSIGPTLHTLPLEEIESGYHADGKLPQVSSAECYHGKDLVVHPATVTALANAGLNDRAKAKHEIEEVLEHLGAIKLK